jgi:hypothetical protein
MPQVLEQGDIFGRIGKAFGEGAAGGAEKQLGANLVSKSLETPKGEKFDPLKTTQRLIKAQASPQEIASYLPLIQQAQARAEAFPGAQGANVPAVPSGQVQPSEVAKTTPTSLGKSFQPLQRTEEALWSRAAQLASTQPTLYRDPNDAYRKALSEYEGQQSIIKKAGDEFDTVLERKLQKSGKSVDPDIIGDMKHDWKRESEALAATGQESPEKAADKLTSKLLDFAKSRTALKGLTTPALFGGEVKGKEGLKKLDAIRKEYEDNDRLELFSDDLVGSSGLSTPVANYLAFPIKGNKDINNFAESTRTKSNFLSLGPLISGLKEKTSFINRKKGTKRTDQEIGDFVSSHLGDNDSLNSIALTFKGRGYDPQKIMDIVQENWNAGKTRLNKRQQRELETRGSFRPTMRDIAYFAGNGLNPLQVIE